MTDIRIPKLNNNDATYTLVEWLAEDDEPVKPGDDLATLETSKAAQDLVSEESGVLWHVVRAGSECQPGDVIGRVVPPGPERTGTESTGQARGARREDATDDEAHDEPVITQAARALAGELSIDPAKLRQLGI